MKLLDGNLDTAASDYDLKRRRYLWGLFVETDRHFRKRILHTVLRPVDHYGMVETIAPGVVRIRLTKHGKRTLAEKYDIHRRWWRLESRQAFERRGMDAIVHGLPLGVSASHTVRGTNR